MKFLTRTIILLAVFNLANGTLAVAQTPPQQKTLTISGSVGLPGVRMIGLPGNIVSDQNGYYVATVPRGFTGTAKPIKEGYTFEPASMKYTNVISNVDSQDYMAKAITLIISGNAGVSGVVMKGLPNEVYTDQRGYYVAKVMYGWSGTVTPAKEGYTFEPERLSYARVVTDQTNGNYAPSEAGRSDPYGSIGSSRSRSRRRGSALGVDPMYGPSVSAPRGRSSGYEPIIRSGGRKALVIPAGEVKPKELAETIEDMHVMSHILDERFKKTRRVQGMFTDFGAFFGRDSRSAEATYLEGFGVLFLMEVNFAFSPPPKKQAQDPAETAEAVDSTWQKARQQVLSPGTSPGMGQRDSADDYGSQMVEELKVELVKALKHAGNIRNIEPDEWIILTVIGGQRQFGVGGMMGSGMGGMMSGGMGGMMGSGMGGMMSGGTGGMMSGGMGAGMGAGMGGGGSFSGFVTTASSPSTVLTIRAKKSDVDDFARDVSDFEQFQEKVTVLTY